MEYMRAFDLGQAAAALCLLASVVACLGIILVTCIVLNLFTLCKTLTYVIRSAALYIRSKKTRD